MAIFFVLAAVPVVTVATAESGKDKDKNKGVAAIASSASSGVGAHHETPDQKKRRQDYARAGAAKIKAIAAKKAMTPAMKALVQQHWQTSLRLLRIQRIAENAGKTAVAKRAADAIAKEDARFFAKMDELAKAAPAASGSASAAPPSSAPAAAPASSGGAK